MPAFRDLTGQTFGYLVAQESIRKNNRTYWKCICKCGTALEVRADSLTSGRTISCGCKKKELLQALGENRRLNLAGERFGRLLVLERDEQNTTRTFWKCLCDCGNYISTSTDRLRTQQTQSCGCLQKERTASAHLGKESPCRKDITNQRFGKLIALEISDITNSELFWRCKCDCGNFVEVRGSQLRRLHTISCGCIKKSYGEEKIEDILKSNAIRYEKEKTFSTLRNPKTNAHLRLDFYLPDYNTIIEFDGEQHYKESEELVDIQFRDKVKDNWALENNIKLIRIPFWDRDMITDSYLLDKINNK